jgi:hypothetical protein
MDKKGNLEKQVQGIIPLNQAWHGVGTGCDRRLSCVAAKPLAFHA